MSLKTSFWGRGSVEKSIFVAAVNRLAWFLRCFAVIRLPYGTTQSEPQIPDPHDPSSPPWPAISSKPSPTVSHTLNAIHLKTMSLTGHFKVRGHDPSISINVCVTKWPQRVTPNWAHTEKKSDHWSMSPVPPKDRRKKNNNDREGEKVRKNKRRRTSGGRMSQRILKVNVVRGGLCLQRGFYFFYVDLYLRVSPSVQCLNVWGRRGNGRVQTSQDLASIWASSSSSLWPLEETQSKAVNLLIENDTSVCSIYIRLNRLQVWYNGRKAGTCCKYNTDISSPFKCL